MALSKKISIGPLTIREHLRNGTKSGSWQLDIPPHLSGTGKRKRTSFAAKRDAENAAKRLLRNADLRKTAFNDGAVPAGITFKEISELWVEFQKGRVDTGKKRQSSLETNAFQLRALLRFFGTSDAGTISEANVTEYQKARLEEGRRPRTINSELATFKQVLSWAKKRRMIRSVPEYEAIPSQAPRLDLPTIDEVAAILANIPDRRIAALVRTIAETGLRKGEVLALRWTDLDHQKKAILVRPHESFTPKTYHSHRDVFVSGQLLEELVGLPKLSDLVFPGRGGVKRTSIAKSLRNAVVAAGIFRDGEPMHLNLHMLRKAHATWQAMKGTDPSVLQVRLGHAPGSRVTQQVYVHATQAAQRQATIDIPSKGRLATNGNSGDLDATIPKDA